jgi:hypothetical protein
MESMFPVVKLLRIDKIIDPPTKRSTSPLSPLPRLEILLPTSPESLATSKSLLLMLLKDPATISSIDIMLRSKMTLIS